MLNPDTKKTKDPQLSELAGLMNVKDFSLTIVLAEAVGVLMSSQTGILSRLFRPSALIMPPNRPPKTLANLGRRMVSPEVVYEK